MYSWLFAAAGLATPFWLLMIFAPGWSWTRRVMSSPWSCTPPLVFWFVFALPNLAGRVAVDEGPGFVAGAAGGVPARTLTLAQLPAHTHAALASTNRAAACAQPGTRTPCGCPGRSSCEALPAGGSARRH